MRQLARRGWSLWLTVYGAFQSDADGVAKHWHVTSGKCLHTIKAAGDNQLFAVDYRGDGATFATAGSDKEVGALAWARGHECGAHSGIAATETTRFAFTTKRRKASCLRCLEGASRLWVLQCGAPNDPRVGVWCSIPHVTVGHSNRVFSLKFVPGSESLLVSGGWDSTVQVRRTSQADTPVHARLTV